MEEILEPDLVICDSGHHLYEQPDKRYMLDDLTNDTQSGHRVEHTIYIECGSGYRSDGPEEFRSVGEPEFVVNADPEGFIAGIVAAADLRSSQVDEILEALKEAGKGRVRGIRTRSIWDPDPDLTGQGPPALLADPAYRLGVAALERAKLNLELVIYFHQIPELVDLARAYPNVPMILDHLGFPLGVGPYQDKREEVIEVLRGGLRELATCENAFVKIGGIGMPRFGFDWHERPGEVTSEEVASAWGPEIQWCIEQFGVERCMFESNFPSDKQSYSYVVVWNVFKRITGETSPSEKAALFHDTAMNCYRLN